MKKILVCQHVAYEILGTLNPLFKDSGFRIRYVNFDRTPDAQPTINGYAGLIILGGPMNVDDPLPHLAYEVKLIQDAIKKNIPVLGICLGSQLIAKALGAKVYPNCKKEIGWYDVHLTDEGKADPVFKYFKPTEKLFQWHGDTFDLPPETVHLAYSSDCKLQAFRHKKRVYGFQFHLEVDEAMILRWFNVPRHQKEIECLNGQIDPQTVIAEIPNHIDRLKELSGQTFTELIQLCGAPKKKKRLSSTE